MSIRPGSHTVRTFILKNVHQKGLASLIVQRFGITRQAAGLHLQGLVKEGVLEATGNTRTRTYRLAVQKVVTFRYVIRHGLAEDIVYRDDITPLLADLPYNVRSIWDYAFTEMFNNAIDHSEGSEILVTVARTAMEVELSIADNGVGIFQKIQKAFHLFDAKQAIFELSKGKLTTDDVNHSGQGIFFTSRMVDAFDLLSGGILFSHTLGRSSDWMTDLEGVGSGTTVFLRVKNRTRRTIKRIYDQYSVEGSFGFDRTTIPVRLAKYGSDQLISRSQAKRVLMRVEQFARVVFDFTDVVMIGQAFADQIFRVFALEHPQVDLRTVHANKDIEKLINAAIKMTRPGYKSSMELFPGA